VFWRSRTAQVGQRFRQGRLHVVRCCCLLGRSVAAENVFTNTDRLPTFATVIAYDNLDQAKSTGPARRGSLVRRCSPVMPRRRLHPRIAPITAGLLKRGRDYVSAPGIQPVIAPRCPISCIRSRPRRAAAKNSAACAACFTTAGARRCRAHLRACRSDGSWLKLRRLRSRSPPIKRRTTMHLRFGDTKRTASRPIRSADIEHFAEFTGDNFLRSYG